MTPPHQKENQQETLPLFPDSTAPELSLPDDFQPVRPQGFDVERIVLAKGSHSTPDRRRFIKEICALYPSARLIERLDSPHNKIDLSAAEPVGLHSEGMKTLVFGEHKSAVRRSEEIGNTCPNYWHYSVYGYCFYNCSYCYLAGTRGVWNSPTVKIYVNLSEVLQQIDRIANGMKREVAFYHGKLQDGLALDQLTAYSSVVIPFFAGHRYARQVILTKTDAVERLLNLDHRGRTILSWSLNAPEIAGLFEKNVPSIEARIRAMRKAARAGYPVRAVLMPLIPVPDWEGLYEEFLRRLLKCAPIQRLTLGGICSYQNARRLMESRLGAQNAVSSHLTSKEKSFDGRARYAPELRIRIYNHMMRIARRFRPDLELALCLEETNLWNNINAQVKLGRCNCIL